MNGTARIAAIVAGLYCAGFATGAVAADKLFPDPTPVYYNGKKQEFGTGWYLRGDVSWSRDNVPALFADGNLANAPKARNMWAASIGFGYKINNWLRTDLTLDYRQAKATSMTSANTFACPLEVRGMYQENPDGSRTNIGIFAVENQCRSTQNARLQRGALLANAYLDLGTWSGVTPFVGAGIGVAYGRIRATYDWIDTANNGPYQANLVAPGDYPVIWRDVNGNVINPGYQFGQQSKYRVMNRSSFNLAWALMAGLAVDVSPNAKLELSYRYMNMGKWGEATKANVAHDYRIGFRYMID